MVDAPVGRERPAGADPNSKKERDEYERPHRKRVYPRGEAKNATVRPSFDVCVARCWGGRHDETLPVASAGSGETGNVSLLASVAKLVKAADF